MWEFPGGHLEDGETPLAAAWREWAEETGCIPPPGVQTGSWVAGDGIYRASCGPSTAEASVPVRADTMVPNPDDPDGDQVEAVAWWDPATLAGNPAVRSELATSLGDVMTALGLGEPVEDGREGCAAPLQGPQRQPRRLHTPGLREAPH